MFYFVLRLNQVLKKTYTKDVFTSMPAYVLSPVMKNFKRNLNTTLTWMLTVRLYKILDDDKFALYFNDILPYISYPTLHHWISFICMIIPCFPSIHSCRDFSGRPGSGDISGQSDRPIYRPHSTGGSNQWGNHPPRQKTEKRWNIR